jgi:hypothetical protein
MGRSRPTRLAADLHCLRHFGRAWGLRSWPPLKPSSGRQSSGKLMLCVSPEVHAAVAVAAQVSGKSINQWALRRSPGLCGPSGTASVGWGSQVCRHGRRVSEMAMNPFTVLEVARGVEVFNARYGEMERALWHLSRAAADDVLDGEGSPVVEELIWVIKSWWGIQGVRRETKTMAAAALRDFHWDQRLFEPSTDLGVSGMQFAVERVADFVKRMTAHGVPRREWSLASKVLHWLMPWRIPVYDSFVKNHLNISESVPPKEAYWRIVQAEFEAAQRLLREDRQWLGSTEPRSPFRALDKYLWWSGGGGADQAVVVKDPWRIVRSLGLKVR